MLLHRLYKNLTLFPFHEYSSKTWSYILIVQTFTSTFKKPQASLIFPIIVVLYTQY